MCAQCGEGRGVPSLPGSGMKANSGGFCLTVGELPWTEKFHDLHSSILVSGVETGD